MNYELKQVPQFVIRNLKFVIDSYGFRLRTTYAL